MDKTFNTLQNENVLNNIESSYIKQITNNGEVLLNCNQNIEKSNESNLLNDTRLLDEKSLSFLTLDDSAFEMSKNNILLDLIENGETTLVYLNKIFN